MTAATSVKSIEWVGGLDGYVAMIDQTRLPVETEIIQCRDVDTMCDAIKRLRVRGAPAIGIAAAMGLVLGIRDEPGRDREGFLARVGQVAEYLATSRPTAINLFRALDQMRRRAGSVPFTTVEALKVELLAEAQRIRDEDAAMCRAIGRVGESLIKPNSGVLTYCNAGLLATAEYGTALAPVYLAHELGRRFRVYAPETRPLLQGARLTCWELLNAGVDVTLLCDGMVGSLMKSGCVDLVITGADRIAANGDTANKVGTYSVAVIARAHRVPFYVAAPGTTFDLSIEEGSGIPIEQRSPEEIRRGFGTVTAPPQVPCYCPAFDITPADFINGIVTENGIITPVTRDKIREKVG